jgi:hypothetical protein
MPQVHPHTRRECSTLDNTRDSAGSTLLQQTGNSAGIEDASLLHGTEVEAVCHVTAGTRTKERWKVPCAVGGFGPPVMWLLLSRVCANPTGSPDQISKSSGPR